MYEYEETKDDEARKYAEDNKAMFQRTSAKQDSGIDELFEKIGKHLVGSNSPAGDNKNSGTGNVTLDSKKSGDKEKKKGCC